MERSIHMKKNDLLFYDAYEAFYDMAGASKAFCMFCKDAFGEDFSQDGFSDIHQIDMILPYIPVDGGTKILDIGCGNGKMLGYLQSKTDAFIYGFDYSENAIKTARKLYPVHSEFREGCIGAIEYPEESFDLITSMDTMYFATDMLQFMSQIKYWLKPNGVFFVGYQEGDVMPKTENAATTELAQVLCKQHMKYEVTDITEQTYQLLRKKRAAALAHQKEFEQEGYMRWFEMLMDQTECAVEAYEEFVKKMARYLFVVRK